jgi:general secretion pathway protein G
MTRLKLNKHVGFTIIELLFVIAIIAVLFTIGVSCYSKETEHFKVKKTALQIQHVLQAAQAYYADNNSWPATSDTDQENAFNTNYIGGAIKKNPWGSDSYHYENPVDKGTIKMFTVSTTISDTNAAAQIRALLPAVKNETGGTITTYVNAIKDTTLPAGLPSIAAVGNGSMAFAKDSSHKVDKWSQEISVPITNPCPSNLNPQLHVFITGINFIVPFIGSASGDYGDDVNNYKVNLIAKSCDSSANACTFSAELKRPSNPVPEANIWANYGYMVVCQ